MSKKVEHLSIQEAEDREPQESIYDGIEEIVANIENISGYSARMADALEHVAVEQILARMPRDHVLEYDFNHEVGCPMCLATVSKEK